MMATDSKIICFNRSSCTLLKANFFCLDSPSTQSPVSEIEYLEETSILNLPDLILCSARLGTAIHSRAAIRAFSGACLTLSA